MNPYQFVPLGPPAQRHAARTHESFGPSLQAGTLVCRIKALTEFFIAASHVRTESNEHQRLLFLREHGAPIIPGSSLKGVIRNVAEALSGSCLTLAGDRKRRAAKNDALSYWDKNRQHDYPVPQGFSPCGLAEEHAPVVACPACRMFGYLWNKKVHLGYVNFSTARLLSAPQWQWLTLSPSGSPAPRHRPFYGTPATGFQTMRGRKFYYHRPQGVRTTQEKNDQNKTVEALSPDAVFEFTIDYENLTAEELALLVFALALEEPLRHKFGMGKGVGLGSTQIQLHEWRKIDLRTRYQQFDGGKQTLNGDQLQAALQAQREKFHQSFAAWQEPLQKLREIWAWNAADERKLEYPSYFWFKDFSAVPLEEVPDEAGQHKVRAASASRPAARFDNRPASSAPRPQDVKAAAEAQKEAQKLLRTIEKEKASSTATQQKAYQHNATEPKATVAQADDGTWQVLLPKLPLQRFALKLKEQQFSNAKEGAKIRVRVVVDKNGIITRAEEM